MKIRLDDILEERLVPKSSLEPEKPEDEEVPAAVAEDEVPVEEETPEAEEEMVPVMRPVEIPIGPHINIRYNPDCTQQTFSCTLLTVIAEDDPNWAPLTSHITLLADDEMLMNEFNPSDFERVELSPYEEAGTTYLLMTNDPVPVPPPPPPEPTEEELRAQAVARISQNIRFAKDSAITNGVTVETEYGVEHFTLSEDDRILLLGINSMVMAGATAYPYHSLTSDGENKICTVYSDEDIGKIAVATFGHVTYHESYANMLMQWLYREKDLAVIESEIFYGAILPRDLIDYLGMILMASGMDPNIIPGYIVDTPEELPEGGDEPEDPEGETDPDEQGGSEPDGEGGDEEDAGDQNSPEPDGEGDDGEEPDGQDVPEPEEPPVAEETE